MNKGEEPTQIETETEYQARVKAIRDFEKENAYPPRKVLRRGTTRADLAAGRKAAAARFRLGIENKP